MCLKVVKHVPQRWLSLFKAFGRIIRLWHPLCKLYAQKGEVFPLNVSSNRAGFLQLHSLMDACATIMRDGQHGRVPVSNEMHMALSMLKTSTLDLSRPLKVRYIFSCCLTVLLLRTWPVCTLHLSRPSKLHGIQSRFTCKPHCT